MIDYVKILLLFIDIERLRSLSQLTFYRAISEETGEYSNKVIAEYHYCKISIFDSGIVLFSGSIHKLYNSLHCIKAPNYKKQRNYKGYNGNQFTLSNIIEVRTHLTKLFNCEPQQMQFQNIEFGINAETNVDPQIFIKGLLYQKGKKFEFRYNDYYSQAVHQRYILKIYNKSDQYGMDKHTLRIETKELKAIDFLITGIKTFADINTKTLERAKQLLLKRFDEVVYYDYTMNKKVLTKRQKKSLNNYSNARYWFEDITVKKRYEHKNKLRKYISAYSQNIHQKIRVEINKKGGIINRLSEIPKRGIINSSSIGLITPYKVNIKPRVKTVRISKGKERLCLVTGLDISMQKNSSILLSHTGLRYYLKTDKKIFDEVAYLYLSKKWKYSDIEIQIKELAHNIRNKHNNNSLKQIRLYNPNQICLF